MFVICYLCRPCVCTDPAHTTARGRKALARYTTRLWPSHECLAPLSLQGSNVKHISSGRVGTPEGPAKQEDTAEPKVLEWPMSQVSERWDLPSIIKAMLRWTSRLCFVRAAQNVVHWKGSKHIIYMSAFIVDGTHLVCHDQNLRKLICAKIQGDEGLSQPSAACQGLNLFSFRSSQSLATPHHPSRINFPLHNAWPTNAIKHHPCGHKVHRPLCNMGMLPQLLLPRLSLVILGLYPSPFGNTTHGLAHLRVSRCPTGRSLIPIFATSALSPQPIHSSELFRRPVRVIHDPNKYDTGKDGTQCLRQCLSPNEAMKIGSGYLCPICTVSTQTEFQREGGVEKKLKRNWNYI